MFNLEKNDDKTFARAGTVHLYHGDVQTPVFMPVGTNGPVKTFLPYELKEINAQIILSNAYHLYLRPGLEVIEEMGDLHSFTGWDRNILTDSGGFQIFSLNSLNKIKNDGIEFRSHIDGSKHFLSAKDVVDIQKILGSDIMMVLDHCTPPQITYAEATKAVETTARWAAHSREQYAKVINQEKQKQFGIVQGNFFKDLREKSAKETVAIGFDGYAIGGLSVGESKDVFADILSYTAPLLPENKPRYLMGVGTPEDIFTGVTAGVDMFDCVLPTRIARNGSVFTNHGRINLRNEQYKTDHSPMDNECDCYMCKHFSKAYIRHLLKAGEISALRMTSYHNIYYMKKLMEKIRDSIIDGTFVEFRDDFLRKYKNEAL